MSKQFKLKFAAVLGVAVLAAACAAWAATEALKPAEANRVLARVEGREITEADVNAVLQSMGPQGMMMYGSPEKRLPSTAASSTAFLSPHPKNFAL